MNPSRENGNSSMLMVLLLLLSGTMMLVGLSSHLTAQYQWGVQEARTITRYAGAQSAISWGMWQQWRPKTGWQCQTEALSALRACIYPTQDDEVLMAGFVANGKRVDRLTLWHWGRLKKGQFIASAHGWLDYCPLGDKTRCNLAL